MTQGALGVRHGSHGKGCGGATVSLHNDGVLNNPPRELHGLAGRACCELLDVTTCLRVPGPRDQHFSRDSGS
jgi:hypothetical protein